MPSTRPQQKGRPIMTKTNDNPSLESRIEAIEQRLANLADMQLLIREYILALQQNRDKMHNEQASQAVSESLAWQEISDSPAV